MKSKSWVRLLALYTVSFVAIALAEPHRENAFVAGGALIPAIVSWLIVRRRPVGLVRALIRGSAIVLLFAGFVALGSAPSSETIENATGAVGLPLTTWADAFLAIGVVGLFGSLFGEPREKNADA